jgi:hypothetical protein
MIWSALYPYVLPSVIGCPDPTLDLYLRQAAIEFARRTLCDCRDVDLLTANGTDTHFELDLPLQTQAIKLRSVSRNGLDHPLVDTLRGQQLVRDQSTATFAFTTGKRTLDLHPLCTAGDVIGVNAALAPSLDATSFDGEVYGTYIHTIASGALAALQMMPGQSWSSPQLAMANRTLFLHSSNSTAMHFARGQSSAKLRSFKTYL